MFNVYLNYLVAYSTIKDRIKATRLINNEIIVPTVKAIKVPFGNILLNDGCIGSKNHVIIATETTTIIHITNTLINNIISCGV